MKFFFVSKAVVLMWGIGGMVACTTPLKHDKMKEVDLGTKPRAISNSIPFTPQTPELCGPTALYMAMKPHLPNLTVEELTQMSFTPGAKGTFKQDLLAAARRYGMATYPVENMYEMMDYLSQGVPVVLFHSTSILWREFWHYSVLTGYNADKEVFTLHIGDRESYEMDADDILDSWSVGGNWAYVLLPPNEIPKFATLGQSIDNGLAFLRLGKFEEAKEISLESLRRWPEDFQADIILADVMMKKKRFREAHRFLKQGVAKNPSNVFLKKKEAIVSEIVRKM